MNTIAMIAAAVMLGLAPVEGAMSVPFAGRTDAVEVASTAKAKKEMRVMVLRPTPEMHCANCEKRIKENIRFEAGVKKIVTDREKQTVAITYDASKTNVEQISKAFAKIGYEVALLDDKPASQTKK